MKLEISYNLVVGNDIESTFEPMFAVLSIQESYSNIGVWKYVLNI